MSDTDTKKAKKPTTIGGKPIERASDADMKALIAKAEKELGEGSLFLGSEIDDQSVLRCTTGVLAFDLMLGGGWPLNQWNEIIGYESNGKTAMVLKTIAANQAKDPTWTVLWIDAEHFVLDWAVRLGVDLSRVYIVRTNIMEEAFQVVTEWLNARACDCVVIDSYPALTTLLEEEKSMDELTVGTRAKLFNLFMRKSGKAIKRSLTQPDRPVLGIIINQWRDQIGGFSPQGTPKITPGGKGKNYSFFTRVEFSRLEWIQEGGFKVGLRIKARTIKNKTAPAERTAQVDFYTDDAGDGLYKAGAIDKVKDILTVAMQYDVVTRAGSWYSFGPVDESTGKAKYRWNGGDAAYKEVLSDLTLQAELDAAVRQYVLEE